MDYPDDLSKVKNVASAESDGLCAAEFSFTYGKEPGQAYTQTCFRKEPGYVQVEGEHMEIPMQYYKRSAELCAIKEVGATVQARKEGIIFRAIGADMVSFHSHRGEEGRNLEDDLQLMQADSEHMEIPPLHRNASAEQNESKYMEIPVQRFNLTQFLYEEKQMVGFNVLKESTLYLVLRLRIS